MAILNMKKRYLLFTILMLLLISFRGGVHKIDNEGFGIHENQF